MIVAIYYQIFDDEINYLKNNTKIPTPRLKKGRKKYTKILMVNYSNRTSVKDEVSSFNFVDFFPLHITFITKGKRKLKDKHSL